jgi:hypothetical protein
MDIENAPADRDILAIVEYRVPSEHEHHDSHVEAKHTALFGAGLSSSTKTALVEMDEHSLAWCGPASNGRSWW